MAAKSRGAAVCQTVKVKAERSAQSPKLCLFWITFNSTEQAQKPGPKNVRDEEEGKQEKKGKTRGAPNFFSTHSAKNCLPVLTFVCVLEH